MAKKFAAVRRGYALRPCDAEGQEILRGLNPSDTVMVEVKQPRNVRQHRLLFGLLRKVIENLPLDQKGRFPNEEALLHAVKIATGHTVPVQTVTGETILMPKSISFASMDQGEFGEFFRAALQVITEYVIEDLDSDALLAELDEMTGVSAKGA